MLTVNETVCLEFILSRDSLGKFGSWSLVENILARSAVNYPCRRFSWTNQRFNCQMRPSITVFIAISQWTHAQMTIVPIDYFYGEINSRDSVSCKMFLQIFFKKIVKLLTSWFILIHLLPVILLRILGKIKISIDEILS